jgi:hypothetical protein
MIGARLCAVLTSTTYPMTPVAYNFSFSIVIPSLFSCSLDGCCCSPWQNSSSIQTCLFLWQ